MDTIQRANQNRHKHNQLDLKIFQASRENFDALTDISRICFPNQMRWREPRSHSRQWWELLTDSDFCEMWVCSNQGRVIGYIALVFDRIKYEDAWERHCPNLWASLYIFATCPILSVQRLYKKFKHRFNKQQNLQPSSPDNNRTYTFEKIRGLFDTHVPWCGPSAVIPGMQGKGVATTIYEFCLQRARELGHTEVRVCLKRYNIKSKGLVEKLGFVQFDEVEHALFYTKTLESK